MKTTATSLLTATLALLSFTAQATEPATVSDLTGQWHGKVDFTGISYAEATQKKVTAQNVELTVNIAADGTVTGHVGGAEFTNCVVASNRGWFGRTFHLWSDFIIRGQIDTGAPSLPAPKAAPAISTPRSVSLRTTSKSTALAPNPPDQISLSIFKPPFRSLNRLPAFHARVVFVPPASTIVDCSLFCR